MWKNRVVIPQPLRGDILKHLHIGHQGTTSRLKRSEETIWWPNLKRDLEEMRKTCQECIENHPSLPKEKPKGMIIPEYPFQSLHADYFHLAGKVYLLVVDGFSSWPIVEACSRGGTSSELKDCLVRIFTTYGIPMTMVSDGGPQFTAHETQEFMKAWGVQHRITSAYNPHANMRAETGVKSMKRILRSALGGNQRLNDEKAQAAMLEYRNTPIRDVERTPAQMLFGRHMRGLLQIKDSIDEGRYMIQKTFQLWVEEREEAFLEKIKREGKRWEAHTKDQAPLKVGQAVVLQSMRGNDKGKWTSSGTIWEADATNSKYNVKMDGTGRLALRNRVNIRPISIQDARGYKDTDLWGPPPYDGRQSN